MSVYLYRLGRFAFRRKWIVLPVWLLLLVGLGVLSSTIAQPMEDDFNIPNLPSERATEIMDEHFPGRSAAFAFDAVTGTYVIAAPEGSKLTDPQYSAALDGLVTELNGLDIVDHKKPLTSPLTSAADMGCLVADRSGPTYIEDCSGAPLNVLNEATPDSVALLDVSFGIEKWQDVTAADREAANAAADAARAAGLDVQLAGSIAQEGDDPGGSAELIGMGVAFIVMIIAFGALLAAVVPIITAIVGLAAATMLITVGTSITTIPSFTTFLATMVGIALSIDYALFIVSRYKHELAVCETPEEAAGRAVGTAGSAVVFAGLTVFIALCGLSIIGVSFMTWMGLGGAVAALMAVIVALTLMPALLGAFGRFLFRPKVPFVGKVDPEDDTQRTVGQRIAELIARKPAIALTGAVAILAAFAIPAIGLQIGLPGDESMPADTSIRQAYDLRTEGFGEGTNGILQIAADLSAVPEEQRDEALAALRGKLESFDEMDYVVGPQRSDDGSGALFQGVPQSGPNNQDTKDLVKDVRAEEAALNQQFGIEYGVTGTTAIFADVDGKLLGSIVPYLAIIVIAAFLLLIAVFRSVIVPLLGALGFVLSMAATFGATVLIFQDGALGLVEDPHPLTTFLPIMLIGLVFGLAMDYQVFLVTRIREEHVHGAPATEAMVRGYHHGARVVTAAAIIMISVFGAFLLESNTAAKSMGFALAAGVFFDAFIVRMVLVPAVLVLVGDRAWWLPHWLDRIVPSMDVEGEKLGPRKSAPQAAEPVLVEG
ncbi:MMPL family transporter [Aldersonia sp. NBC_00410]|uniref:MMPL family transporter n=1 Tax=Aldersonia sp. NBC_00410 TaxID=2975954 RepID=UPI0022596FC4|nr:MMPL family transporter [Aldersonia sp. NBC_00410]MCX5045334.1 MMPL family transporter [Aldersonia sp. NBC_00410]